jgi:hypothetical protein
LLKLIAGSFIPGDALEIIEKQCTYDPVNERYTIENMELAECYWKVVEEKSHGGKEEARNDSSRA